MKQEGRTENERTKEPLSSGAAAAGQRAATLVSFCLVPTGCSCSYGRSPLSGLRTFLFAFVALCSLASRVSESPSRDSVDGKL